MLACFEVLTGIDYGAAREGPVGYVLFLLCTDAINVCVAAWRVFDKGSTCVSIVAVLLQYTRVVVVGNFM
jgi:hypothetical protein